MSNTHIEYKSFDFNVSQCKQIERDGIPLGIIEGYASTWEEDRTGDIILRGAFSKTLFQHKERGSRPIRMYFQHSGLEPIGGFPIEFAREDETGLFVVGEINLNVQRGAEVFSLAKQGVMTDLSVGIIVQDSEFEKQKRIIKEVDLFEVSVVSEPANLGAQITALKNLLITKEATPFTDLPLADQDLEWDSDAAIERVREWTDSIDEPSSTYLNAFFWYDRSTRDEFGSYKLPFADVIDGQLRAVPRGIFAAAGALEGARGGVDIPEEDRTAVVAHVERYYEKMGLESPFEDSDRNSKSKNFVTAKDIKQVTTKRELESLLRDSGAFSLKASVALASKCFNGQSDSELMGTINKQLRVLSNYIRS